MNVFRFTEVTFLLLRQASNEVRILNSTDNGMKSHTKCLVKEGYSAN